MKDCMSHFAFYCWSQSKEQIGSRAKAGQAAGMQHPQFCLVPEQKIFSCQINNLTRCREDFSDTN